MSEFHAALTGWSGHLSSDQRALN